VPITGEFRAFGVLIVGVIRWWPLARMLMKNSPRSYDPKTLLADLLR
jgi:hypothetical protein